MAGDEARLQRRHHHRALDGRGWRILVYPGDAHRLFLGVSARRLRYRRRPHLPRNDRQSIHDRARSDRIRGDAHQSRPILQRHWPAPRAGRGRHVLLFEERAGESTGSANLWIPYAFIGCVVIVLAIIFYFANVPDIKMEDDYHLDDSTAPNVSHSIWSHPHFWMAVLAQFLYVAAQAGIFSFFINYMTSQVPPVPASWSSPGDGSGWFETHQNGALGFSNKAASNLASLGFLCFLIGRFTGSAILKKFAAHKVLGFYSAAAVVLCLLIFLKLGWVSVACVFLTYFFMSIMFPTIFALGIFGLGERAKKASSFIVMAIMGGAILPKVMGHVADAYDLSRGFIVPMLCFGFVAAYGFLWPKLSGAEGMHGVSTTRGH